MKLVLHLPNCTTCQKILAMFPLDGWDIQNIKTEPITEDLLEKMHELAGSYEALFSKRSTQIKIQGINLKTLTEADYKRLLLSHYTFLKRPVFMTDDRIFIGNSHDNIVKLEEFFSSQN